MKLNLQYDTAYDTRPDPAGEMPADEAVITLNTSGVCHRCKAPFDEIMEGERFIFDNLTVSEDGSATGDLLCPKCADPHLIKETVNG